MKRIVRQVKQLEKSPLYKIAYVGEGSYEELPEQKEVFIFRIFQDRGLLTFPPKV